MCVYVCACVCVFVCAGVRVSVYVCVAWSSFAIYNDQSISPTRPPARRPDRPAHTRTHTHTHTHTQTHAHTHTHTHTSPHTVKVVGMVKGEICDAFKICLKTVNLNAIDQFLLLRTYILLQRNARKLCRHLAN